MTEIFPVECVSQEDSYLTAKLDEIESEMHELDRRLGDEWFDQFGYYPGDWIGAFRVNCRAMLPTILLAVFSIICLFIVHNRGG